MTLQQQKEFIALYKQYNSTDKAVIKDSLKHYMNKSGLKINEIAGITGIPVQSLYQLRKPYAEYCPEFIPAIIICDCLGISVTEII